MRSGAIAALMLALLPAASAYAEGDKPVTQTRTDEQKKEDDANERAYKQVIKATEGKAPASKNDPWHQVRPPDGPKR
jgi:hypothetical protein